MAGRARAVTVTRVAPRPLIFRLTHRGTGKIHPCHCCNDNNDDNNNKNVWLHVAGGARAVTVTRVAPRPLIFRLTHRGTRKIHPCHCCNDNNDDNNNKNGWLHVAGGARAVTATRVAPRPLIFRLTHGGTGKIHSCHCCNDNNK